MHLTMQLMRSLELDDDKCELNFYAPGVGSMTLYVDKASAESYEVGKEYTVTVSV